jgi:Iron-containing redox enzyme
VITASTGSGASARLVAKLEPLKIELGACSNAIAHHERPKDSYVALLRMLYSSVRGSAPMMELAVATANSKWSGDPICSQLVEWLREDIEEERHHDDWILDDYAVLEGDREELRHAPGSPSIAAAVGSVYYWAWHAHPVAVLGYCTDTEADPISPEWIDALIARTGFPEEAFSTYRHHSSLDRGHRADLLDLIDRLPLEPEQLIGKRDRGGRASGSRHRNSHPLKDGRLGVIGLVQCPEELLVLHCASVQPPLLFQEQR